MSRDGKARFARLAFYQSLVLLVIAALPQVRFQWPVIAAVFAVNAGFSTARWWYANHDGVMLQRMWKPVIGAVRRVAYGELGVRTAAIAIPLAVAIAVAGLPWYAVPAAIPLFALLAFSFIDLGFIAALLLSRGASVAFAIVGFGLLVAVLLPFLPGASLVQAANPVHYYAHGVYRAAYGYAKGSYWLNAGILLAITLVIANAKTLLLRITWARNRAPGRRRPSRASGRR